MKIGLIGLPLTGKTTVLNLLTGRREETAAFTGGKQGANLASIKVPDRRIDRLSAIFSPQKTTFAEITFVDMAGFQMGRGGIPSERLNEMRNLDALVHVLRCFHSDEIPRDETSSGGLGDASALEQELILTDLMLVAKRLEKITTEFKKGRKELGPELDLMKKLADLLGGEKALRNFEFTEPENDLLRGYQLVSRLPVILLANTCENAGNAELTSLEEMATENGLGYLNLNAQAEWEIDLLPEGDRELFLQDLGVEEAARDRFIRSCYGLLDLISFFTVGEDEVRAWTIANGMSAQPAAGKIHSDLERGFIRAEVIHCEKFLELGSMAEARKQGALRLEGKSYTVLDGDIMNIRFSV